MVVHELKNEISTVRIHDEFLESDPKPLIGSASKVVSEFYKRKSLVNPQKKTVATVIPNNQPIGTTAQP